MKKFIGGILPLLIIHLICCGSILFFLIGSGYLLKLSNESQNKLWLIPSLILLWIAWKQTKKQEEGRLFWFVLIYLITSYIFITYLFIPWWIPGYDGGPLLL